MQKEVIADKNIMAYCNLAVKNFGIYILLFIFAVG
jgi:hypothetical protein